MSATWRRGVLPLAGAFALTLVPAASVLWATPAHAQVGVARSNDRPGDGLLGRFGVAAAAAGLSDDDPVERRRAVERLADIGTKEAHAALVDALEPGVLRSDARLLAIRALAGRVDDEDVRGALAREVLQAGGARRDGGRGASEPSRLTAALVLARSGNERALLALGNALREGGATATAAREALLAYPPASLGPLAGRVGPRANAPIDGAHTSAELLAFFGELGDARTLPVLRAALGSPAPGARASAARALAALGDAAALTFATQPTGSDPALRIARAEVLVRFADPRAIAAVSELLADPKTRGAGLGLARRAPDPRYATALIKLLGSAPELADDVVPAIGECATTEGVAALAARLADRRTAPSAAVALARSSRGAARDALTGLLAKPASELGGDRGEAVALAGIVRALALGDTLPGLEAHLDAMVKGAAPSASELAAFGLVALGMRSVSEVLEAKPSSVSEESWWGAAGRGALARGPGEREVLARAYLARVVARGTSAEAPDPLESAAAVGLLDPRTAEAWPTSDLLAATRRGGVAAPLAARELARRDDGSLRADVDALLGGSDPAVRVHVALGLGRGSDASATSRLAATTLDEVPAVRAAAVRALSHRGGPRAARVLATLGAFDADAGVRALARLAAAGRKLHDPTAGAGDVGVIVVDPSTDGDPELARAAAARRPWTARVTRPDGLLVPVVVPSGGWLVVPGIGAGASSVALFEPARSAAAAPSSPPAVAATEAPLAVPAELKKPASP